MSYRDRRRKLEILVKWRTPHVLNLISVLDPVEKKPIENRVILKFSSRYS